MTNEMGDCVMPSCAEFRIADGLRRETSALQPFQQSIREFFGAIKDGGEPNSSVAQVLPCYEVMHRLEQQLSA